MSTTRHPNETTLADYLSGTLDEARRVVVAAHMELCPSCRQLVRALDTAAGAHLDALPGAPLAENALDKALSRLDTRASTEHDERTPTTSDLPITLRSLAPHQLGPWRWIGPGVHWRSVSIPAEEGARVFLLKAAAGTRLPTHAHLGTELTVILKGSFTHAGGRFAVGDCDDADASVEHSPVVGEDEECICLVAMQGNIRLLSLVGRLIQPFVRM